jgi:hypothetical protein
LTHKISQLLLGLGQSSLKLFDSGVAGLDVVDESLVPARLQLAVLREQYLRQARQLLLLLFLKNEKEKKSSNGIKYWQGN